MPLGQCAQLGSACVLGVSTPHQAPCAAVMVSPTPVHVSCGKLPAGSRYKLKKPGQDPVSKLNVAQEALALERKASVSGNCASSVVASGMRTQRMGHVSVTSAVRVS